MAALSGPPAPPPRLTGCRCQCTACSEFFASPGAFDRHRRGSFAVPGSLQHCRRCMTLDEMSEAGWSRNPRGFLLAPDRRRAGEGVQPAASELGGRVQGPLASRPATPAPAVPNHLETHTA